jgi:hypothetical protein
MKEALIFAAALALAVFSTMNGLSHAQKSIAKSCDRTGQFEADGMTYTCAARELKGKE